MFMCIGGGRSCQLVKLILVSAHDNQGPQDRLAWMRMLQQVEKFLSAKAFLKL
jgi:hypothetical protein